jgi:hypothetical protein
MQGGPTQASHKQKHTRRPREVPQNTQPHLRISRPDHVRNSSFSCLLYAVLLLLLLLLLPAAASCLCSSVSTPVTPASRSWHSMCSSQGLANSADTWRGVRRGVGGGGEGW